MAHRRRFSAFVASDSDSHSTILEALQFARDFLRESCLDERARVKAAIIVEELVSNCLHHGDPNKDIALWLSLENSGDGVQLHIEDDGGRFDPTQAPEVVGPDPKTGGGVGLAIVAAWASDITYARTNGCNALSMTIT
ncbi:MAG: ATP-binding protein [Erythrobacter sp.]